MELGTQIPRVEKASLLLKNALSFNTGRVVPEVYIRYGSWKWRWGAHPSI